MAREELPVESRVGPLMVWYAHQRGVDVGPLIERYHLPADLLTQAPGKLELLAPLGTMARLADELAAALDDPHVGLSMAEAVPKGAYGVSEFLIRATSTLRQALTNLGRYSALLAPGHVFRFEETDAEGQLHFVYPPQPTLNGRHLNEYTIALMVIGVHTMTQAPVVRAWFTTPRPSNLQRLADSMGTSVLAFEQPTSGFAVARDALELPLSSADAALCAFLEEHAQAALASRPKTDELVDTLRRALELALREGEPSMDRVAQQLELSSRTLQRRLGELHTSFQEVLDQLRFDLARSFLSNPRLDVGEVAYLLGYSDLRAFDRAFRRWASASPREWRARSAT